MSVPRAVPARIHVLLAGRAPVGLVIRRGPSKQVATYLWDRERDTFTLGQWMKGRIFERRSDLSPDGKHFLYFASGRWRGRPAFGAWTAISRAPWLSAIALLRKDDCWHGGGLWTAPNRYWLNDGHGHAVVADSYEVKRDPNYQPIGGIGGEDLGVYFPRLLRDGWEQIEQEPQPGGCRFVWQRPLGHGWALRKVVHAEAAGRVPGRGCYWDEHQLVYEPAAEILDRPDWEWADCDGRRLTWAPAARSTCSPPAPQTATATSAAASTPASDATAAPPRSPPSPTAPAVPCPDAAAGPPPAAPGPGGPPPRTSAPTRPA